MAHEIQGDGSTDHRFWVDFEIQGFVEITLPGTATDKQINKKAIEEIKKDLMVSRGSAFDIQIGMVDGPF